MAQLDEMFQGSSSAPASEHLVKGVVHDWAAEPYARLGYTHAVVGGEGERDFRTLAAPLPNGRVLFAGEAYCSAGANMTVHSALDAGHRAAGEVVAFLSDKAARRHPGSPAAPSRL